MMCVPTKPRLVRARALPLLLILSVLACLCVASSAYADVAGSARRAVVSELRSRHGSRTSVSFVEHRIHDLRGDEHEVTGSGYYVLSGSPDRRNFDYTVRVNDRTDATWNLSIRLRGTDEGRRPGSTRFEFRAPRGGEHFSSGRVRFSGYAESGDVRVEVYDRDGRRVDRDTMSVRDGRWEGWMNLRDGRYQAVAELVGTDHRINVRFTVGDDSRSPSTTDRRLKIVGPRERDDVTGPRIEIYGDSDSIQVIVRVLDRNDQPVVHSMANVRNGRWSVKFNLREGRYHVFVEPVGALGKDEVRFTVR